MKRFLFAVNRVLLGAGLFLLLGRPAGAFEYLYSPTNTPPNAMYFNGSATNLSDRFQLTPNMGSQNGSIVLDNLPKTPIKAFTVRFGLQMTNTLPGSVMADGISFNFGPGINTDSVTSEKGIGTGLAVAFDTFKNTVEPYIDPDWVPGLSIRWNDRDLVSQNISTIFNSLKTTTNFHEVIITLQPAQTVGGLSTVTVQYQGVVLSTQVQYSPAPGETWRMMFAGRTGFYYSQHAINQIRVTGQATELTVSSAYGAKQLIPPAGINEITEQGPLVVQAPEYVYLDRYRRELDPTPENINSLAHYRARLDNPAATVTLPDGPPSSLANGASLSLKDDTTVTWHWILENLAEVNPGTAGVSSLSPSDITDAAHVDTLGRRYLRPGDTGFDSLVNRSVLAAGQGNVRFGSRGYVMENAPNSPERYLELAGEGDHLRATAFPPVLPATAAGYTLEFWARRNPSASTNDQVVIGLGANPAPGQQWTTGFGGDGAFFVSDGATRVSADARWTDDSWHHWAAVGRSASAGGGVSLYRDGVLVQQSGAAFLPFTGGLEVTIGARAAGTNAAAPYSGGVNNVRVWGRVLDRPALYTALATRQFPAASPDLLLEMPFDSLAAAQVPGVRVEHLAYPPAGLQGVLRFEAWNKLSTTDNKLDTTLLADPRYPDSPSTDTWTPSFDSRPVYPDDTHDGYGGRMSGWITPTVTAQYRFFLRSDDTSRFFISPDDNPAHLVQEADEPGCCHPFTEPASGMTRTSRAIQLQAGKRYAVAVIWKEGAGIDLCQVAWRQEGDPTPAANLLPVPGDFLSVPSPDGPSLAQLDGATLLDSYQTNNFLLPSTNDVPLRPEGYGSDAWRYRTRLNAAAGGRYSFDLQAAGPTRLWVDGRPVMDPEAPGDGNRTPAAVDLTPGQHVIELETMDGGGPRSLSVQYSPDLQLKPLAPIPDANLSLAASDLLSLGLVTVPSTEGRNLSFVARGFERLFPANTSGATMLAAIQPGFRLGLTSVEGGQNTVQIASIGKAPLDDWRRVFWGWDKEFQFKVAVLCTEEAGAGSVNKLPYFAGEVATANIDSSTNTTTDPLGGGASNVLETWLREGERLTVGTIYRTPDRRYTLTGISGSLNFFSDITVDRLMDGFRSNGVSREYTFPAVTGPGSLTFTYERTIHRVSLPLGQALDVSSLSAVNTNLFPELPAGATNLVVNLDGPLTRVSDPAGTSSRGGTGPAWVWDYVGRKWHPTKPGKFTITWPDLNGRTNTIEVTARFPTEVEARSGFGAWEYKDGSRHGSSTNGYLDTVTYPGVATNYPGAPLAHYTYNVSPNGVAPAPGDLDPSPTDPWFFKQFSYAENNSAQVNNTRIFTDSRTNNRSVLVFTRRPDPAQAATGDLGRESVTVRVLNTGTVNPTGTATAASRLESPYDTAGFRSGRITPGSSNYNPALYNTNATTTVGQWGPVYPVNLYSASLRLGQPLSVDWYATTAGLDDPTCYLPQATVTYQSVVWPDPVDPATPVIYISSQLGSEGVGQVASTNGIPNYQEVFDPAGFSELTIYQQPDRRAIGYNPNEEHALIAPSKAYVLSGDPRFNLGQSAAFALQNGLNQTNLVDGYTSHPFVLVQYRVPGATNASDAFGMKAYAVQTVRPGDESFPRVDRLTGTAFQSSGQPVSQPANPRYDFQYPAVAGSVVVPPYPLNLVIGNVVLTNTTGGNLVGDGTVNAQRALWADRNGVHWVVSGGWNARFFERYFYPLREDFWLGGGDQAKPTGTPVAWVPPSAARGNIPDFVAPAARPVAAKYNAQWGNNYPVLKRGETLTYPGGEYRADHPASPGLPAVLNMASAELVFDGAAPSMLLVETNSQTGYTLVQGIRGTTYYNDDRRDGYIETLVDIFTEGVAATRENARYQQGRGATKGNDYGYRGYFTAQDSDTWLHKNLEIPDNFNNQDWPGQIKNRKGDSEKSTSRAHWLRTLLKVEVAGDYTFYLESGDGSQLYLDGEKLVDADGYVEYVNDGAYKSASATKPLSKAFHVLEVQYFDQGPKSGLDSAETRPKLDIQYACAGAGISKQQIPPDKLYVDPDDPFLTEERRKRFGPVRSLTGLSARVTRPLDRYAVSISKEAIPVDLQPANPAKVLVSGSRWYFKDLPASLGKRFYYDSLVGQLVFRGRLNDLESGAPDLTRQPVQPYVLEPNFLNDEDAETLIHLTAEDSEEWKEAIEDLQDATSTPYTTAQDTGLGLVTVTNQTALPFYAEKGSDAETTPLAYSGFSSGVGSVAPVSSFGIGSALVPSPGALARDHNGPLYLTIAENNDPRATGAVALHIIQLSEERYRGSIQVLTPSDAFSEKINLKHTGDFGGNTAEVYYQWWVHDIDPLDQVSSPDDTTSPTQAGWQIIQQGLGLNSIDFEGDPRTTLADKFFMVRYGGKEELQEAHEGNVVTNGVVSEASWRHVLPDDPEPDWAPPSEEDLRVPYQWAGAANSPQLQADGSKRYIPQLVMGWVKRILDQINPYEARFSATFNGDAPATYSSMLQQAGGPYIGPVALNSDKSNLENVGLIQLYETVLQRAKDLTQGTGADAGTDQALLLAATRLASLYGLLAGEAWADAQTGIIPQSPDLDDNAASALFAFKNEVATPLDEQLALLRGTDFLKAYPSFNRLFWNYLKADGEAAYNAVYHIGDANSDGLINEADAAIQYPMGHGDAWGHYLSAVKMHYDLLRRPGFTWLARKEYYSLLGNVLPVDYLDEKTFTSLAAARTRAGLSVMKATYAQSYSADPAAQWQGYTDTANPARAWGVTEWSRRTGQGAWFDWLAANAMTPAPTTGTNTVEGLDRLDRAANQAEIASLAAALVEVQQQLDNANRGQNPIGLDADALAFDIDPFYDGVWWERSGQFQQVYGRALAAARNALAAYNFARRSDQQLRRIADDTSALKSEALMQDLDYRNRLIAIYGRPYQGTVGPGKIFAEGYTGPDLLTYMYVDFLSPEDFRPKVKGKFVWQDSLDNDVVGVGSGMDFGKIAFEPTRGKDNQLIFDNFYLNGAKTFGQIILDTPNHPGQAQPGDTVLSVELPIFETSDWALKALPDWGSRPAFGQIQNQLGDTLAIQTDLDIAVEEYGDYTRKVQIQTFYTRQKLDALKEKLGFIGYYQGLETGNATAAAILNEIAKFIDSIAKRLFVGKGTEVPIGVNNGTVVTSPIKEPETVEKAIPNNFTLAGGGDIFSPLRLAREIIKKTEVFFLDGLSEEFKRASAVLELETKIAEITKDAGKETMDTYNEFLDALKELSHMLAEEEGQRGKLMAPLQKLYGAEVSTLIAEGERLQLERAAFNRRIAASAQRNRYADLVVRLSRNEAARKFDAALDNALRYAWLAAKAYDYETSLSENHPAGIQTLLDQIVQTRSLGLWQDGEPQVGNGGLADLLARLKSNYDALQGQIGLNNAQFESSLFSLRTEAFRISTDQGWVDALKAARVPDLWKLPEFRQYCRPFDQPANGPQPGLVVEFSTEMNPGRNFFGRPLSALDHGYSTANYATKIRELAVGFPGYDQGPGGALSISPRVYLIPVGQDVQRCSDTRFPTTRTWNVVSQRIPTPYVLNDANLRDPGFQPSMDGLDGSFVDRIRFGDFRAFTSDHDLDAANDLLNAPAPPGWSLSARLYGRSVWNTRWLLIIPGATLSADPNAGLDRFIESVTDIKLFLQTYSNMGM